MSQVDKLEAASLNLDAAIELHEQERFVPAITLAGAAEEILGKLVERAGGTHALASESSAAAAIFEALYGATGQRDLKRKEMAARANFARDNLKHLNREAPLVVDIDPPAESYDIIGRAVSNYVQIVGRLSPAMERFDRGSLAES
jgi:hypothetical protein